MCGHTFRLGRLPGNIFNPLFLTYYAPTTQTIELILCFVWLIVLNVLIPRISRCIEYNIILNILLQASLVTIMFRTNRLNVAFKNIHKKPFSFIRKLQYPNVLVFCPSIILWLKLNTARNYIFTKQFVWLNIFKRSMYWCVLLYTFYEHFDLSSNR